MNSPGRIYVFDWNTPQEGAKPVECYNFPSYGTKAFAPHGISIFPFQGKFKHKYNLRETLEFLVLEQKKGDNQLNIT